MTHVQMKARRAQIVKMFEKGQRPQSIAEHFNVSLATVQQALREVGYKMVSQFVKVK